MLVLTFAVLPGHINPYNGDVILLEFPASKPRLPDRVHAMGQACKVCEIPALIGNFHVKPRQ
jgi:hypothetical protein